MREWRPVAGFEGYYSVSSDGLVRRDKPAPHTRPGLILTPRINRGGYFQIGLRRDGQRKRYSPIHKLVALAFLTTPPYGAQVNHIDGDKLNNAAENLEWVSPSENSRHAFSLGLSRPHIERRPGTLNPAARLTPEQVLAIREDRESPLRVFAERFGVGISTIHRVRQGATWKEVMQ